MSLILKIDFSCFFCIFLIVLNMIHLLLTNNQVLDEIFSVFYYFLSLVIFPEEVKLSTHASVNKLNLSCKLVCTNMMIISVMVCKNL